MKKLFLAILIACTGFAASAQTKYCFVDSEYILKHIPEYKSAQTQLDDLAAQWQKDVDDRYTEIEKLYKAYQAEQVLLSDDMRAKREQEIIDKEKAVKAYQQQKFGFQGDLFKRREELIKPIQDKIFKTIQKYAEQYSYGVIFDKSGEITMLYASPRLDKSNDIIEKLGFRPGDIVGEAGPEQTPEKTPQKSTTTPPKKK